MFGIFKKKSFEEQEKAINMKIAMEQKRADAVKLRRQAIERLEAKKAVLRGYKMHNRPHQINQIKQGVMNGAGLLGRGFVKTSKAVSGGVAKVSQNYAKNLQNGNMNMLNQVMGIQPIQPKVPQKTRPKPAAKPKKDELFNSMFRLR